MRVFTIERDRQTGRSRELMRNAAAFLESHPNDRVLVLAPFSAGTKVLASYLVEELGKDNMSVKRVRFVSAKGNTSRGWVANAVYVDNADYVDLDTFLSLSTLMATADEFGTVVETGKDPLWIVQHRKALAEKGADSRRLILAIEKLFEEEARVRGV